MSYNSPFRNIATIRLGDFIERSTTNNHNLEYGVELIEGVTNEGMFAEPKGSTLDIDLKPYKIVNNGAFVYNPSRLNLGSIAYRTNGMCIVSHLYIVFYLNDCGKEIIDPEYLFMYFRRNEFYREVTFRNFGSQRPEFNFVDMSNIHIPLPPLPVQQKYVAIYKAMQANQQSYERGLEDLKQACFESIEKVRKEQRLFRIGEYISPCKERNSNGKIILEQGINIDKQFITPQRSNSNLLGRKIVRKGQFAYCTQLNNANVAIAYREDSDCVVSSVYDVFEITRKDELLPHYLLLWLIRPEFGRFVYWASEGSAYEFLNYNNLSNYKIPIPDIETQKSICDLYQCYTVRRNINEKLRVYLKEMCPILIRGSLSDGG